MREGWYLMSTPELERLLQSWRAARDPAASPDDVHAPDGAIEMSIEEALAYRDSGNLPDPKGRTLRLVLVVDDDEVATISTRRLDYEPDFHDAPVWRRPGSKPVNVVPLRTGRKGRFDDGDAWWDEPELARLEEEWASSGRVGGLKVPAEYRSFVFKTVLALQAAGREVTADSVADSVARWLPRSQAEHLRTVLGEESAESS